MRKYLLALAVLAGSAGIGAAASAAPSAIALIAQSPAHAQSVQYYAPDWRARQRARAHERWRQRHEWRRRQAWRREHQRRGHYRPGYAARPLPYYGYAPR